MKVPGPQGEVAIETRETFVFPNQMRHELGAPESGSRAVRYFDGSEGWESTPRGVREMNDVSKQFWRAEVFRNTFNLLRAEGEFSVQFEKREKVGESEAEVLLIRKESESVRLFVEPASGRLLKKAYRGIGLGGPADIEQTYSDYREVGGVWVPFRVEITQNGFPILKMALTEIKFDTGVNPAELAKKPE